MVALRRSLRRGSPGGFPLKYLKTRRKPKRRKNIRNPRYQAQGRTGKCGCKFIAPTSAKWQGLHKMIAARANVTVDLLKGKTAQKQSFKELLKKEEEANEEVRSIQSQRAPVVNTAWNNPDHERYSKWKDETIWPREYVFLLLLSQHWYLVSSCI